MASAGNQLRGRPHRGAALPGRDEDVIGVAGANVNGAVDDFSVHGPHNDVSAPGGQVLISFHANGDCLAGDQHPFTSWAAGFVSGLAAQLREKYPRGVRRRDRLPDHGVRRPSAAVRAATTSRGGDSIQPYEALTMTLDPNRAGPELPGARSARGPG